MREGPDVRPTETPTTSVPMTKKRPYASTTLPAGHPPLKFTCKDFWTARLREIPLFECNPWDFYEPFLKLGSGLTLVLCNNSTEVRVMRIFGIASRDQGGRPLLQVQHPNFIDIYEGYLYEDEAFVFIEYLLAAINFIRSRKLDHQRILIDNIFISSKGDIKINPTNFPDDKENISEDSESLGTIMLQMMNEERETLEASPDGWSAEAVHFVEATATATPEELSDHIFLSRSSSAEVLTPLCTLVHLLASKDVHLDKNLGRRLE
ncbi:hypothetical protein DL98DRAFT_630505 [Cadophora sp. DSE1049]|nr:hypothetical protein DL98DRAFT_630505 [Cadophora sp. DSE1049]